MQQKFYNVIESHNSVLRDKECYEEYSSHSDWFEKYFAKYCQSHKALLWLWIMLWNHEECTFHSKLIFQPFIKLSLVVSPNIGSRDKPIGPIVHRQPFLANHACVPMPSMHWTSSQSNLHNQAIYSLINAWQAMQELPSPRVTQLVGNLSSLHHTENRPDNSHITFLAHLQTNCTWHIQIYKNAGMLY